MKKEKEVEEINKKIILEDLDNYLNYLEKEKINKKEDIILKKKKLIKKKIFMRE